jgi:2-polyprenyl-3-methyl-5-hydroxy-6-metoxy-1,4-benzoquinol methylase
MVSDEARLRETRCAFDHVAGSYDGPRGNNELIRQMRAELWETITSTIPPGSRLLDLGCGTGIDATYLASKGYSVLAVDWSERMVDRTRTRLAEAGLEGSAETMVVGAQDLDQLTGERFDAIYSDLGPLNCVPDLAPIAHACAALIRPGGWIIASVIGRVCPWEVAFYVARGDWRRALLRWTREAVPVPLEAETVWTRYYTPREFYGAFSADFRLTTYRGLRLFAPPPYMVGAYRRARLLCGFGEWLDDRIAALPVMRNAGDHFLITMTKRF